MATLDDIKSIFPKYKQQLSFLREREKLFSNDPKMDENKENEVTETCSIYTSDSIVSSNKMFVASPMMTNVEETTIDQSCTQEMALEGTSDLVDDSLLKFVLPDSYPVPSLPSSLLSDIDRGDLFKFNSHCRNRQILIDAVFFDLTSNYNLWYPSHQDYDKIVDAILNLLRLPKSKENMAKWREAVQTKFKKERRPNVTNVEIQLHKEKYSCPTSGRPVKKKLLDAAQRDRQKQISLLRFTDDGALTDTADQLTETRNGSVVNDATMLNLWRSTLHRRRTLVRQQTTEEVMIQYPEYSKHALVFEEVKLTTGVDICTAVRRQVPALLEKFSPTPMYINDSMPIRLLKVLCRHFQEAAHHTVNTSEPTTPYPSIIMNDDVFHIYVDFNRITSTNSPDDAMALVLSMFSIFELSFEKNSRTLRFLYAVLFGEKRYLSNMTRNLVREKPINIYAEQNFTKLANTCVETQSSCKVSSERLPCVENESKSKAKSTSSGDDSNPSTNASQSCQRICSNQTSDLSSTSKEKPCPSDPPKLPSRSKQTIAVPVDRQKRGRERCASPAISSTPTLVNSNKPAQLRRATRLQKRTKLY